MEEVKLSEKINEYSATNYYVTTAIWRTTAVDGSMHDTYEIGIRSKALNGDLTLLQSSKYNYQSVQEMAELVCEALDKDYSPEWCQEYLT